VARLVALSPVGQLHHLVEIGLQQKTELEVLDVEPHAVEHPGCLELERELLDLEAGDVDEEVGFLGAPWDLAAWPGGGLDRLHRLGGLGGRILTGEALRGRDERRARAVLPRAGGFLRTGGFLRGAGLALGVVLLDGHAGLLAS
jgi:hypothetical protein